MFCVHNIHIHTHGNTLAHTLPLQLPLLCCKQFVCLKAPKKSVKMHNHAFILAEMCFNLTAGQGREREKEGERKRERERGRGREKEGE